MRGRGVPRRSANRHTTSCHHHPAPAIRTAERRAEVAWFSALCNEDMEFLGVPDGPRRSSFAHCAGLVRAADTLGYQNILLPSGWVPGQDALTFAAALAPQTAQINQLVALRMGEVWPPMLARAIATVDHLSAGRLVLNIISSDLPGRQEPNEVRYERSSEIIRILQRLWTTDGPLEWEGKSYHFRLPDREAAKPLQPNGGPLLHICRISPCCPELCAQHCEHVEGVCRTGGVPGRCGGTGLCRGGANLLVPVPGRVVRLGLGCPAGCGCGSPSDGGHDLAVDRPQGLRAPHGGLRSGSGPRGGAVSE